MALHDRVVVAPNEELLSERPGTLKPDQGLRRSRWLRWWGAMGYVRWPPCPWLFRLNGRQRFVSFLGLVLLLLVVLYPEYDISYHLWLPASDDGASGQWYRLGGKSQRAFVTDIRHGEIVGVVMAAEPELRQLVPSLEHERVQFERRTAIRVLTVILQGFLVIALTLLAIWLTDDLRWRVSGGRRSVRPPA